jgi:5-oxoprolinase (ATP-hydrolysing)
MNVWKIAIDTGGTFTDCIAQDPTGVIYRTKVLSTGRLRGKITEIQNDGSVRIQQHWNLNKDLLRGYFLKVLNSSGEKYMVQSFNPEQSYIKLERRLPENFQGKDFEIFGCEEAPILAARIVTETCLHGSLPTLDMRLGSTRGTNALLEKKGIKPILIVSRGFADLPIIGTQQRENLFSLNIQKPEPFFDRVIELNERIDSEGNIILPLTESEINKVLRIIYRSGNPVIVIALLNSYRNPVHESILINLLKTKGYKHLTASYQLGRVISYLPRMQTSLVNAYLMPVFAGYIKNIQEKLDENSTLRLITSSGGLIHAGHFHPKDSMLSGPAGGVIGTASFASRIGRKNLLAFDMGGTSTDVSRYAGTYDYVYQTRVGDQTINSPAIYIETVAAGGGSICSFDGFKFSVGPESEGADPGPACYGAGGALTLTDVNLLLGRIYPGKFGIPVNKGFARDRLAEMKTSHEALWNLKDEDILQGFFDIASEKMARAIEKISIARGYEPSEYSLLAFGGAGGLHTCRIAENLGINEIIIPYDAGILSAVGVANARIERIIHRQVLLPYKKIEAGLYPILEEMKKEAEELLQLEGIKKDEISSYRVLLFLRYTGQDDTIEIHRDDQSSDILRFFREEYMRQYGHVIENREIELESVKLIVGGITSEEKHYSEPIEKFEGQAITSIKSFCGSWMETQVYDIDLLQGGSALKGPAVVINQTSTSFIDPGWFGIVNENHDMILTRKIRHLKPYVAGDFRPEEVQLELFINRFRSITEEMGAILQRTAFSVNIKERLDFSCALLDQQGFLVVNAPHIPVHLGALGLCVRKIMEKIRFKEGDIVITNHPAYGGSHLPDITMIAPVFSRDTLLGFVANRAHHGEIGGISPGSMPADARFLVEEGVVIPPMYVARKGKVDFTQVESILTNSKYPTRALNENMADLRASVASIRKGISLIQDLCFEFGHEKIGYYMKALYEYSNQCIQKRLDEFSFTDLEASQKLDDGSVLQVRISRENERYRFDFTGTSKQHDGNMNATPAIVNSVVLYVLRLLISDNIPLNEGILDHIEIRLPPSLLNPFFSDDPVKCPAVVGGNVEVSQRLVDTLLKALNIVACSQGTMNNLLFGNESFGFYETICGGVGAGRGYNGASAVHQHMTNTKITDPEIMELRYPVRIEKFAVRKNSGGAGQWKGGDGVERSIRFLQPIKLTLLSQHRNEGPYGIESGSSGKPGEQYIVKSNGSKISLPGICTVDIEAGDSIVIHTPGGGGCG